MNEGLESLIRKLEKITAERDELLKVEKRVLADRNYIIARNLALDEDLTKALRRIKEMENPSPSPLQPPTPARTCICTWFLMHIVRVKRVTMCLTTTREKSRT